VRFLFFQTCILCIYVCVEGWMPPCPINPLTCTHRYIYIPTSITTNSSPRRSILTHIHTHKHHHLRINNRVQQELQGAQGALEMERRHVFSLQREVRVYMYVCMYVCMYIYMHVCVCIFWQSGRDGARTNRFMYTYIHTPMYMTQRPHPTRGPKPYERRCGRSSTS
jgi:hypothetical protein